MRRIVLVIGALFLVAALAALAMDLVGLANGAGFSMVPAGQLWYGLDPGSLNLTQAIIERYVWVTLWDPVMLTVLQWPAALVLAFPGVILLALAAIFRRRPDLGDAEDAEEN